MLAAGCGRSGVPDGGGGNPGGWPLPEPREVAPAIVWHSWNVEIRSGSGPHATVFDDAGELTASLELYESGADLSAQPGTPFDTFDSQHADVASQDAGTVRRDDASGYPYVAKNLTARATDDPPPSGVFDLQLHPPNSAHFVVAAFVVPVDGRYVVTDFGAHRLLTDPSSSWSAVLLGSSPSTPLSEILTPDADTVWELQAGAVDLGDLAQNERICFAVYRGLEDLDAFGDATEVSFTITLDPS